MRARTILPLAAALFCFLTAAAAFFDLVAKVRAVDALILFASAFGAGVSFTVALFQARRKKPK